MRRPRLSRRQPIEAAATPLPREETTPPVTNIYFGRILTGYTRKILPGATLFISPASGVERILRTRPTRVNSRKTGERGLLRSASGDERFDARDVFGHVHAHRIVFGFGHADAVAVFQPAKLFELLDALEVALRKRGKFQQRGAAECVQA